MEDAVQQYRDSAPGIAQWLLLELGTVARKSEQYSQARTWINAAIELANSSELIQPKKAQQLLTAGFGELGKLEKKLGNLATAEALFIQERDAAEASGDSTALATSLLNLVAFHNTRGHFQAAIHAIEQTSPEQTAAFTPKAKSQLRYLHARAGTALHKDAPTLGLPFALKAYAELKGTHFPKSMVLRGLMSQHRVLIGWEQYDTAEARLAEAESELAQTRAGSTEEDFRAESAYLQMARALFAKRLYDAQPSPAHLASLRDKIPLAKSAFEQLLEAWQATDISETDVGYAYLGDRSRVFSGWLALQRMPELQQGAGNAFDSLMQVQAMGSFARSLDLAPTSLEHVQKHLLQANEGLLVYRVAIGGSSLFVIDKDGLTSFALPPWIDLRDLCDDLVATLVLPPRKSSDGGVLPQEQAKVHALARRLGQALIPEEVRIKLLKWSKVTIVSGDSALPWIPFEALDLEGIGPLGLNKAVATLPSIPVGIFLATRPSSTTAAPKDLELLFLGAPEHSPQVEQDFPSLGALVLPQEQLAEMAASFPAGSVEFILGAQASPAALSSEALARTKCLQLFCHGIYQARVAHPAALVLSPSEGNPSGILGFDEILHLNSPPLVIVAACGAAKETNQNGGDGGHSLSGAWFQAGADTVIHSKAQLDFRSTWALTRKLQGLVAQGLSPAEALRKARIEINNQARFAHPYYHSLISATGLAQRLNP